MDDNGKPTVEDRGTVIFVQFLDEVSRRPLDTRDATALTATVRRPNGTSTEITLEPSTHPYYPAAVDPEIDPDPRRNPAGWKLAGGWAMYITQDAPDGPSWWSLGGAGPWRFLPRYALGPQQSWRQAEPFMIDVYR